MASSDDTIYNLQAGTIVKAAFKKIGVTPAEQALQAFELQDGLEDLNLMLKTWQNQSFHLWTLREGVVFLEPKVSTHSIGGGLGHNCEQEDFIPTTLTATAAIGIDTLSVASTAGMQVGDVIGVQLSNTIRQWSTITTVDSSTQVTIADVLTAEAVSGYSVFTYTTTIKRPSRISSARRVLYPNDIDLVTDKVSRSTYYNQSFKNGTGVVSMFYYSPDLNSGKLQVWQTGSSVNDYLRITYQEYIDTVTETSQTLEIPPEWQECVIYNLAVRIGIAYDVPENKLAQVGQMAQLLLTDALGYDQEPTKYGVIANYSASGNLT